MIIIKKKDLQIIFQRSEEDEKEKGGGQKIKNRKKNIH